MTIEFINEIPGNLKLKPILISGSSSADYSNETYLKCNDGDITIGVYQIKYQVHYSPFKQALMVDNLLAVGHEENFYLFDIKRNENVLKLMMNGYFGHLYYDTELFYVADASGLYCINKAGNICWNNAGLGIDGVIVNEFTDSKILGSGEFDPPGGWEDFSLDKETGIESK